MLLSVGAGAQKLASLPQAQEIVTGVLPNGLSYYLVTNGYSKGFADFALVRKSPAADNVSRGALSELPHFQNHSPYQYLAKNGSGHGKFGYRESSASSELFIFPDVPVSDKSVSDTTLLMLFDISATSPYEQAVIVSGDIKVSEIKERMNVFSMMVTPRQSVPEQASYEWIPSDGIVVETLQDPLTSLATISLTYRAPRTPAESMNTILFHVTDRFSTQLGAVLERRCAIALKESGIPYTGLSYDYSSSADGPGDETYRVSLTVKYEDQDRAVSSIASVFSALDSDGATSREYRDVKSEPLQTNEQYVRKCIAAYLYNADLASPSTVDSFFTSRDLDQDRELSLFNNFVSAIFDPYRNLTIAVTVRDSSMVDAEAVRKAFSEGWERPSGADFSIRSLKSVKLPDPGSKTKFRLAAKDNITGGETWTFANGLKVIVRNDPSMKGRFAYAFQFNGAAANVPDLFRCYDIAGISGTSFRDMLQSEGIVMRSEASQYGLLLSGEASVSQTDILLRSILAIAYEHKADDRAVSYERQCRALADIRLKESEEEIFARMDAMQRTGDAIQPQKEDKGYYSRQFAKFNDGMIVLTGDFDDAVLKKSLSRYLSACKSSGTLSSRAYTPYSFRSGSVTYTVPSEESIMGEGFTGTYVLMSAALPYSLEREASFRVAEAIIEKAIANELAGTGYYAEFEWKVDILPVEKCEIRIRSHRTDLAGLPADVYPLSPIPALSAIRTALKDLQASDADVKLYKALLTAEYETRYSKPETYLPAVVLRYSAGKDVVTSYKDKIGAVSASSVNEVLQAIAGGSRVEYVIF